MRVLFLIILIGKLVYAEISIDIVTGTNASDVSILGTGTDILIVTDHEVQLFDIGNRNLKEALKKHYEKTPTSFYLKSPTPWGDLYKEYQWDQVTRVLSIKRTRVKGISKKPVIVAYQDFDNLSNRTIKVNTAISQTVENTVTTSWTKGNEVTVSQEIEYKLNVYFAKISGTTAFSFTSSWGKTEEKSETVTIGTTSAVETELQPGQAATATLTANKGYLEIEVIYMATLKGNVAVNFKKAHNGHHFWGPSIKKVMKSGGIKNEITATEVIKVGFYTDASLKVYDKVSGQPL